MSQLVLVSTSDQRLTNINLERLVIKLMRSLPSRLQIIRFTPVFSSRSIAPNWQGFITSACCICVMFHVSREKSFSFISWVNRREINFTNFCVTTYNTVHQWLCGRVPDVQSEGFRFESRIKVYSAFITPGSVNEYQLRLGRQRQVWLISLADETQGVQVKLWCPLTMRAIPERLRDASCEGAIQIDYLNVYLLSWGNLTQYGYQYARLTCQLLP